MSQDVWVVAEHFQGHLNDITFELLGKGREVATRLNGKLAVVVLGSDVGGLAGELRSADVVYVADRPDLHEFTADSYGTVLEGALKEAAPRLVLLGSTSVGLDLLSLLSARGGFGCLDNCTRLEIKDGRVIATSQIYGGKIFAEVALSEQTTLVGIVPGMFPKEAGQAPGGAEVRTLVLSAGPPEARTVFRRLIAPPPGDVDISKVPILVAVGRGVQNAENLPQARALAEVLGGEVCGSRPVIDQGWLPKTRQVGKSGMTVKPKLYLALGVSGAPEHVEGMRGAELIVAINTDAKAPIFGVAHYGIVADLFDVLPHLTEQIRGRQGSHAA
jgi:electron transfer flavoprotein alpha subunit